jgi:GAF domain-containing protein
MRDALRTGQAVHSDGDESRLAIPVRVRDQVVGVIDGRKRDGTSWSREERELLEAMVEQLNVALEGAQLYRETQRRAAQEQAIGQVTSSIRQSLEIDDVLRTAAEQIRETLGLGKAVVRLAVPEDVPASNVDDGEQE